MKFVIAARFDNYIDAHLAQGNLLSEDINCELWDENTITTNPVLAHAVGGIKLMVAEPQAERAMNILSGTKKSYQEKNACPHCGSTNVEYVSTPRKASNWLGTFFSLMLGGGSAMPLDKANHCFDCGCEYEVRKEL